MDECRVKLISSNPECRKNGCQSCVPAGGAYPGLPQSHCYRCGLITRHACKGLPDKVEPNYHPDPIDMAWWWILERLGY